MDFFNRSKIYQKFSKMITETWDLRGLSKVSGNLPVLTKKYLSTLPRSPRPLVWFHAASAGELEILWPLIEELSEKKSHSIIVSSLSKSAAHSLIKLKAQFALVAVGISPLEGQWSEAFTGVEVSHFVTAKYEAWPELWCALSELKIPLTIVSAQMRSSLKLARRILKVLGVPVPRIQFLTSQESLNLELQSYFPEAAVRCFGESRWDRVFSRTSVPSERAEFLLSSLGSENQGILAQIWDSDLPVLKKALRDFKGTLWVVPHSLDPHALDDLVTELGKIRPVLKTSTYTYDAKQKVHEHIILVDEMGVLAHLYSKMNWAYVGGGFGKGVHNTMEPAVFGLPICCGPCRADEFPEITQLKSWGELNIVQSESEFESWLSTGAKADSTQSSLWKTRSVSQRGATGRIVDQILEFDKI